jgi:DNA-binding response OmpR family regulator
MFRGDEDCPETRAVVLLHVEDHAEMADAVRIKLEDEGWSVETCTTGAAALEKLESGERFDALIFDYKLPDTTGIELIKQTRKLAHRLQTPIIMFSGDEVELEARRAGANYFLRKPGELDSIPETVARLLARRKGRES